MSDSRDKLNEAQFHLRQMKEHKLDRKEFGWCLSAFVTAARSITEYLKNEFGWGGDSLKELCFDADVKYIYAARTVTVHRELHHREMRPLDMRARGMRKVHASVALTEGDSGIVIHENTTNEQVENRASPLPTSKAHTAAPDTTTSNYLWFFDTTVDGYRPSKDIVTLCEELLTKLEPHVTNAEISHTNTP